MSSHLSFNRPVLLVEVGEVEVADEERAREALLDLGPLGRAGLGRVVVALLAVGLKISHLGSWGVSFKKRPVKRPVKQPVSMYFFQTSTYCLSPYLSYHLPKNDGRPLKMFVMGSFLDLSSRGERTNITKGA